MCCWAEAGWGGWVVHGNVHGWCKESAGRTGPRMGMGKDWQFRGCGNNGGDSRGAGRGAAGVTRPRPLLLTLAGGPATPHRLIKTTPKSQQTAPKPQQQPVACTLQQRRQPDPAPALLKTQRNRRTSARKKPQRWPSPQTSSSPLRQEQEICAEGRWSRGVSSWGDERQGVGPADASSCRRHCTPAPPY